MDISKTWEQFEEYIIKRDSCKVVVIINGGPIEQEWEVWKASRESIEVNMPKIRNFYGASSECEEGYEVHEVVDALEALGFKLNFS